MAVKPIPEGYRTLTPHLNVSDGAALIEFYKKAFGAEETRRTPGPDGKIMHAEMRVGDSVFMLNDEYPGMARSPKSLGGTPVTVNLYVQDADAAFARAEAAGAKVVMPLADQFWGDRYGVVEDPSGHNWAIMTHIEDVSPEEMQKRMAKMFGGPQP